MSKKIEDIEPTNADGKLHGLCIWYHYNGKVDVKQRYFNGELYGIQESYYYDGEILFKEYYINGECVYDEWYDGLNIIEFNI